ncbi:MAG: ABC transporter ATP-binding protein, partial [Planctomycetaceae bacterium]
AVAGSLLFRDGHTKKPIRVLSGGERARLCMAGLLLGTYNILVLDEPGNHLDVETVESLADALLTYKGTVLFTSHDRHFVRRIATTIVEVRDGRVRNYSGSYDDYLYYVNKEIEDGERERASGRMATPPAGRGGTAKGDKAAPAKDVHQQRKTLRNLEKTISRLDEQKKSLAAQLLQTSDAKLAMDLHVQLEAVTKELTEAEERWCALQEELGEW